MQIDRTRPLPRSSGPAWQQIAVGLLLLAGLVALLNLTGVLSRARELIPGLASSTPTYATTTVGRGNVTVSVTATGPVSAITSIPLSFKESGKLAEIKVNVGDHVTKGQVLATLDTSDLQIALEQAQASLAQARANLAKVQAGSTAETVAAAQTSVDNAKQTVADAQASLASTRASNAKDLEAAQANVATAQTNLQAAQASLASIQDQAAKAIAADQLAIANDQKNLDALQASLAANLPVLEQQVEQAKDNLWSSQISRDATCGRDQGASCQAANASVAAAETAVSTAQANLAYQQKQAAQQVASAQATLDAAKAQLAKDQAAQQAAITSAQNQVKQSQAALHTAQVALEQAQAKAAASEQSAQAQVTSAVNAQRSAEASYNQTTAPPLQSDLDAAKAQVQSAQAAVDQAQANLNAATLVAPFDGTIAAVNGSVGQWISGGTVAATSGSSASSTAIFTLMDLNNLQVVAQVNEADVSKVQVGDPVTFNVSAFPDQTFQGKVLAVQPVGTTSSNVVVYNVTSSIQSTKNATLYPGMTATVTIISAEHDNVLTVPSAALSFAQTAIRQGLVKLQTSGASSTTAARPASSATTTRAGANVPSASATNQSYLVTLNQGKLTLVPVSTGLSDGSVTEITSGVNPGDVIVTSQSGSASTRTTTSTSASRSPLVGGPP